ncbi:MAG: ABC transporter ATP-binding protein [candidate division Zixibacteria bacterium]|nr:ABC transporter ATP-binding protein [candidate division Zixibacteria bacterium]
MGEPIVLLKEVSKNYEGKTITPVLHGIDLTVQQGEFTALMGPSGSGKSTLLNLLGLLDRPTSGSILIAGTDTTSLSDEMRTRFRGETIGFVFQFHHLLPAFTALENVMLPAMAREGHQTPAMRKTALELLDAVGLSAQAQKIPTEMSGGQQQRVAVARALAMNPRLVLADEPTGNLDTKAGQQVFDLMRHVNASRGITFLIVTHDDRLAHRCDRIVELVDGEIAHDLPNDPLRQTQVV